MSSLAHCIDLAKLHPIEADSLKAAAQVYRDEGFKAKEANVGAVRDAIKTLEAERNDIISQIKKQLPDYFKAPKPPTEQPELVKVKPKMFGEPEKVAEVKPEKAEKLKALDKVERQATSKFKQDGLFEPKQKPMFQIGKSIPVVGNESLIDLLRKSPPLKKANIGLSKDGSVWVRNQRGKGFNVRSVTQIEPDRIALEIGHGRMLKNGEFIKGKYQDGTIELQRDMADEWTVSHETIHMMEDLGFLTSTDIASLRGHIKRLERSGKWDSQGREIGGTEDRAIFVTKFMRDRSMKGRVGRVLQKIADLVDMFVNLFRQTARGVMREIESGKVFEREGMAGETLIPEYEKTAGRWHSQMTNFLSDKLPGKGSPAQFKTSIKSWAKKGLIKQEELEWSGLNEWLDSQEGKVTKQQVLDFLAENNVQIQEVVKGESRDVSNEKAEAIKILSKYDQEWADEVSETQTGINAAIDSASNELFDKMTDEDATRLDELASEIYYKAERVGDETKFSQYTLPGGKAYKELLLTLPAEKKTIPKLHIVEGENSYIAKDDKGLRWGEVGKGVVANKKDAEKYLFKYIKEREDEGKPEGYKATHWEEPSVLAHIRFDERTGPNGEKILHIAEIQSDWHQEGRKKGYDLFAGLKENELPKGWEVRQDIIRLHPTKMEKLPAWQVYSPDGSTIGIGVFSKEEAIKEAKRTGYFKAKAGVPDAPFKKTWPLLTIRRMVRYAAENGFDAVSWDTGEVQADRYDLSKQVNSIDWFKVGNSIEISVTDTRNEEVISNKKYAPDKLSDVIGKELTDKIQDSISKGKTQGNFKGLDLKVGGEGMKSFYDRLLPNVANKFFNKKAWGKAKVGEITLESGIDFGKGYTIDSETLQPVKPKIKVHSLPITPEMKSKALSEGMPLYEVGKKPLPDFMADFIKAQKEKAPEFGSQKDVPPPKDLEKLDSWLKDQADIATKTLLHFMPKNQPHLNVFEKVIASPEWYQHPVMKQIVRLFTRNRSELYHNYFNYLNNTNEENDVIKTLKDLKYKGLSTSQRVRGKTSKEYQFLLNMIEEVDINWQKDSKDTLEEHYIKVEKHYKSKGATDEVIRVWRIQREAYDNALALMQGQMEDLIRKITPKGPRSKLTKIEFGEASTKNYGKQYLETPDKFEEFFTVTHKTATKWGLPSQEGINYVVGNFKEGTDLGMQSINFKKELFDEDSATEWWVENRKDISLRLKESELEQSKELRKTLKGALTLMGDLQGSYAPRSRTPGNWAVQAYKETPSGKIKTYREHRGSFLGAKRLATKLKREGWTVKDPHEFSRLPESIYQDIKAVSIAKAVEEAGKRLSGRSAYQDLSLSFNEELLEHVSDLIKARGFRSSMIHRHGKGVVEGYNKDPLERFLIYTNSLSGGLSKAKVAESGTNLILGEYVEGEKKGGIDPAAEPRVFEVATEYLKEQLRNIEPSDRLIGLAKSITTFKYLGFNLRSIGVNLTAMVTTAPASIHEYALKGKVSFTKIGKEITKAGKDYAKVMRGKKLSNAEDQRFIEDVTRLGYDDPQYTREALGHLRQTHQKVWPAMMDASMYLFGVSEKWNRGATMLAAFRLAKQNNDYADAVDLAKEASDRAHATYGKATYPTWAQGKNPFAKGAQLFYMYSKFGHNYVQMCYDLGMRKHNIKAFTWAALSPLVLAGGAAFPFRKEIFAIFGAILKAIGIDRDPEKWVWDSVRRYIGGTGELIARHGITGAAGVDISGSLSIGIGVPKGLLDLTGAAGGVVEDVIQAGRFAMSRQPGRAFEMAIPRGFENILRGIRESKTGLVTRRGKRIWTPQGKPYRPSARETALRVAGFRSSQEATIAERTWESKREEGAFNKTKTQVYESYRAYLANPDPKTHKEIMKRVREYNKSVRDINVAGIKMSSMRRQIKSMKRPTKRQKGRLQ